MHHKKLRSPNTTFLIRLSSKKLVSLTRSTPLAEKRSVDDQLEWLDNNHVLYSLPETANGSSASTDIWLAAIDGARAPRLFLKKAYSPSAAPLP